MRCKEWFGVVAYTIHEFGGSFSSRIGRSILKPSSSTADGVTPSMDSSATTRPSTDDGIPVAAWCDHRRMLAVMAGRARADPVHGTKAWQSGECALSCYYHVRMNVRTNLLLPEELVEAIDEIAGPRGRSRYVTEVLTRQLRRNQWYAAAKATAGAWKDHPLFPTDESVVEWVRAGRAEGTDPWDERR